MLKNLFQIGKGDTKYYLLFERVFGCHRVETHCFTSSLSSAAE
jgi:hypothetical protein